MIFRVVLDRKDGKYIPTYLHMWSCRPFCIGMEGVKGFAYLTISMSGLFPCQETHY